MDRKTRKSLKPQRPLIIAPFLIREITAGLVWSCAAHCVWVSPRFSRSSATLTVILWMSRFGPRPRRRPWKIKPLMLALKKLWI